ncbi:hypothetical protein AAFF_G00081010 [Aldrovandia affinis]|uniref:Uncharacterized protein n=1 Tax=Aldrovandia affinis TaxID=143900 RepID=A0AAD7WZ79_9TELE|nr:hypothetical protein AAFF_G00081010 [Aldrovandia affinis]
MGRSRGARGREHGRWRARGGPRTCGYSGGQAPTRCRQMKRRRWSAAPQDSSAPEGNSDDRCTESWGCRKAPRPCHLQRSCSAQATLEWELKVSISILQQGY